MARYDYCCDKCGVMEIEQSIKDNILTECPKCGKIGLKKMVSVGTSVIFKGNGWYETDYKQKKGKKE